MMFYVVKKPPKYVVKYSLKISKEIVQISKIRQFNSFFSNTLWVFFNIYKICFYVLKKPENMALNFLLKSRKRQYEFPKLGNSTLFFYSIKKRYLLSANIVNRCTILESPHTPGALVCMLEGKHCLCMEGSSLFSTLDLNVKQIY